MSVIVQTKIDAVILRLSENEAQALLFLLNVVTETTSLKKLKLDDLKEALQLELNKSGSSNQFRATIDSMARIR